METHARFKETGNAALLPQKQRREKAGQGDTQCWCWPLKFEWAWCGVGQSLQRKLRSPLYSYGIPINSNSSPPSPIPSILPLLPRHLFQLFSETHKDAHHHHCHQLSSVARHCHTRVSQTWLSILISGSCLCCYARHRRDCRRSLRAIRPSASFLTAWQHDDHDIGVLLTLPTL